MASSRSLPDEQTIQRMASRYPEIDIPSIEACLVFLDTSTAFSNYVDSYLSSHKIAGAGPTGMTVLSRFIMGREEAFMLAIAFLTSLSRLFDQAV